MVTAFISHKRRHLLSALRILSHLFFTTPCGGNQGLMRKTERITKVSSKRIHSTNIDSRSGEQKQMASSPVKLFTSVKEQ